MSEGHMSSDLVSRLRERAKGRENGYDGSYMLEAATEIESLRRRLNLREEQIDGYERQLGIIDADASRTIGSEIEQLQARCRELKVAYDRMFDKAAELERRLAGG